MSEKNNTCSFCRFIKRYQGDTKEDFIYKDKEVLIVEMKIGSEHLEKAEVTKANIDGVDYTRIDPDYGNTAANEFFEKNGLTFMMDGLMVIPQKHSATIDKDFIRSILKSLNIKGIIDWDSLNPDHSEVMVITNPLPKSDDWEFLVG